MNLSSAKTALRNLVQGSNSDTLEERNARNLILSGPWLGFLDGGIMTYLGVWLVRMGATPALMGLLASAPQLVTMIVLLPAGAFAERQRDLIKVGNRAAVVHRAGFVLMALLPLLLAPTQITPVAIGLWAVLAIPSAIYLPILLSIVQKAVSPKMLPRVNANRWALYSLVGALAIPAIGAMIDHTPFPVGFQIAFVISFVGTLPNLYFFGRLVIPPSEVQQPPADVVRPLKTRLREFAGPFVASPSFVRFNLATALYRVALSMPAGLFSIYWVDYLGASNTWVGIRGSVAYIALVFGYWGWAKVTNRIGHRALLFCSALVGFYSIMTALSPSVEWLIPAAIVWGIFVSAIDIGIVDMMLLSCPEGRAPTFIAVANVLGSAENMVGPLIGAALAQVIGVPAALLVSGVLQLLSAGIFFLLPNREQEHKAHSATAVSP
jgi:MFS family permease